MELLYSNILPLGTEPEQNTIIDCMRNQMAEADNADIVVGYISAASLYELEQLVDQNGINKIRLILGMYYIEGMPERTYHAALRLNKKWMESDIGEIRAVKPMKYHGKVYCFYKDNEPLSAIVGSANLGAIKLEASNRRQYELSAFTKDKNETAEIAEHIKKICDPLISVNIADIRDMPLLREVNTALTGIELVKPVLPSDVDYYDQCDSSVSFFLPLKVPKEDEKFLDDGNHFTKSNINVCYAAPRSRRKARDWYETQLTVSADIYRMDGYPDKNKPFFVITDDGYWFKAHTTSDNNKQFSAVGDELIMGRWLKGRLAAAGLVKPVNNTMADTEREGMITEEMLNEYGSTGLLFKKTCVTSLDSDGTPLDVWMLSFTGNNGELEQ